MTLYRFVDQQKAEGFGVGPICRIAGVSRSAYYDWKQHRDDVPTVAEFEERRLVKEIEQIHDESGGTYGSPRVTIELGKRGWVVNHKRVERLMRIHDIVGYTPKKHRTTTIPDDGHRIPDRVGRNFSPTELDVTWCGDISYIRHRAPSHRSSARDPAIGASTSGRPNGSQGVFMRQRV